MGVGWGVEVPGDECGNLGRFRGFVLDPFVEFAELKLLEGMH